MCCDCCVHQHLHGHFTLPHHLCVSPHQPSVCHHPFHHPFAFLSLTPFWCVCVALSSGIHTLFVAVDALVLASVPLIWDTPCLPSTTACVCGDGVPALPWPCQPLATFLVCFLVRPSSHCFNLHRQMGYMLCDVVFHKKDMKRDTHFFRFPSSLFQWRFGRQ